MKEHAFKNIMLDPTERAFFIERTGVVIRWILIVVCSIIQILQPIIPMKIYYIALPIALAYNGAINFLIFKMRKFIVQISYFTAVGDIIISLFLIFFGRANDIYLWYFVLLVSHAARFGFMGSIISPILFSIFYIFELNIQGVNLPYQTTAMRVTFFLTTGLVSGYLARKEYLRFINILSQQKEIIKAEQKREEMRNVLKRYVSYNVVEELLKNPDSLCIGGTRKKVSVLFSDIQGFTALLSTAEPEEVIKLLNEYLAEMTEIIFKYRGMVDKFVGDAIIGIFGAICTDENDALNAVKCGIAMQNKLKILHNKWKKKSNYAFQTRIGINTGDVILGNIGSPVRMDYTAIGDAVNTASRLQSAADVGTVVISGSTYREIKKYFRIKNLGRMQLKGIPHPIETYKVLGEKK